MITSKVSLRSLTTCVLVYMVFAFAWWAVELWRGNDRYFEISYQLLECQHQASKRGVNLTELQATREYQDIVAYQNKHRRMIFAEGIFFILCLGFGLYVINRSAKREVALTRQRRNFLLSITHELKSPIASLRLILETIQKRDLQREQTDKLCVNGIRDATRLQNLVEDLLLAARLEDNWRPLSEPVDLAQLAHDCTVSLQTRFPKARFTIQIAKDLPLLQADKPGITAVLHNLLENAVKYSPEGSPIHLQASYQNGHTRLQVSDQGIGIPNEEKEAVFEKFYRIGNEEVRNTPGTGLGLYIVKQVVKAHGGHITISDNQPRGTIFTIEM
ncbi:MAG: GHKL domain-containing protein [Saprospiraceae bacterium]|nr:GHKL domain-containing protein [Saprospiraceae bacterium]